MIDPKQLRIGSWVDSWRIGGEWAPSQVRAKEILFIEENPELYRPIPLTDEVLIRAGFKVDNLGSMLGKRYRIEFSRVSSLTLWQTGKENQLSARFQTGDTILNSLHQLQNLIHCLTGTELEIK